MRTMELADALNDVLSSKWRDLRGIEIVSFGVNSVKANEEDEAKLQKVQMGAMMSNPDMRMGVLTDATADGIRNASANEGGGMGPMGAFIGMGMANMAGGMAMGNAYGPAGQYPPQYGQPQQPYPQQQPPQPAAAPAAAAGWTCACGHAGNTGKFCANCGQPKPEPKPAGGWDCACGAKGNTGKFCANCGKPQPEAPAGWTCSCGSVNQGQFCPNCGSRKPAGAPLYKCDKCGWTPEDPHNPPKFCPQCGDPFDEGDIVK